MDILIKRNKLIVITLKLSNNGVYLVFFTILVIRGGFFFFSLGTMEPYKSFFIIIFSCNFAMRQKKIG
jgi:hypothetical protein